MSAPPITLWLDGDACPRAVRDVVFRAAERIGLPAVFVANRPVRLLRSRWVRAVQVDLGPDVADHHILREAGSKDLVVTDDIPLAAALVANGVHVISQRGATLTEENVSDRLAVRDLLQSFRDAGGVTGGPTPYGDADRRKLADALDRWLVRSIGKPRLAAGR